MHRTRNRIVLDAVLRRALEHVETAGEILSEAVHRDFVWDTTTFRGAIMPGTFVGVEEVNDWLQEWIEGFEDWSLDIERYRIPTRSSRLRLASRPPRPPSWASNSRRTVHSRRCRLAASQCGISIGPVILPPNRRPRLPPYALK
jgi:hypothetical protein